MKWTTEILLNWQIVWKFVNKEITKAYICEFFAYMIPLIITKILLCWFLIRILNRLPCSTLLPPLFCLIANILIWIGNIRTKFFVIWKYSLGTPPSPSFNMLAIPLPKTQFQNKSLQTPHRQNITSTDHLNIGFPFRIDVIITTNILVSLQVKFQRTGVFRLYRLT